MQFSTLLLVSTVIKFGFLIVTPRVCPFDPERVGQKKSLPDIVSESWLFYIKIAKELKSPEPVWLPKFKNLLFRTTLFCPSLGSELELE